MSPDPVRIGAPTEWWAHLRDRGAVEGIVCPKARGQAPALPTAEGAAGVPRTLNAI